MAERFCSRCETMVPERGIHPCVPISKAKARPAVEIAAAPVSGVPNTVPNKDAQRVKLWREKNAEKHTSYMRQYMRKRRAS